MTAAPAGSEFGPNVRGPNQPYTGPHTPASPKHRYHIQVFALDVRLTTGATADYASLTTAMKGMSGRAVSCRFETFADFAWGYAVDRR